MKKLIAILVSISIALSGCASTPANPVPVAQVGDDTKTCDAIVNEMQQMVSAQDKAAADRNSQVGTNVALGVVGVFLIVPWFFMDLGATATVEQKAAAARFQRLQQMATDKKSFVLYCDQQNIFNMLPDEIAGKLIKHILAYVNDENPVADDLVLQLAFEPIKMQLKSVVYIVGQKLYRLRKIWLQ
jgi:hypothetical protein